jgi:hypothetical protein
VGCSDDFEGKWTLNATTEEEKVLCPEYLIFYNDGTMTYDFSGPDLTAKLEHIDGTKYKFNHPVFTKVFDLERDGDTLHMTKEDGPLIKKNSKKPPAGGFFPFRQ